MATDALSAWLLKEHETGKEPWSRILEITNQPALAEMVAELRATRTMRNDDVALLKVIIDPAPQCATLPAGSGDAAHHNELTDISSNTEYELEQVKQESEIRPGTASS